MLKVTAHHDRLDTEETGHRQQALWLKGAFLNPGIECSQQPGRPSPTLGDDLTGQGGPIDHSGQDRIHGATPEITAKVCARYLPDASLTGLF